MNKSFIILAVVLTAGAGAFFYYQHSQQLAELEEQITTKRAEYAKQIKANCLAKYAKQKALAETEIFETTAESAKKAFLTESKNL